MKSQDETDVASSSEFSVLNFMGHDRRVPVRMSDPVQTFTALNVRVRMPDGWTYLATEPSDRAVRPTFVNVSSGAMLQLFPLPPLPDSADAADPFGQSPDADQNDGRVQWVSIGRTIRVDAPDGDRGTIPLAWQLGDPRRIGRWMGRNAVGDDVQIGLIAIDGGHGHAADAPSKMAAIVSIEAFCQGIEAANSVNSSSSTDPSNSTK
jgi:hypothetical protein